MQTFVYILSAHTWFFIAGLQVWLWSVPVCMYRWLCMWKGPTLHPQQVETTKA